MRFTRNDRRNMQRRLKDKVPPAWLALFKSVPKLALIVTATIFVTPEAMAEVQARRAEPVFTLVGTRDEAEPRIVEKTYTKEELNKTVPANPVIGLGDRIASEVTALFKKMASNQSGSAQAAAHKKLKTGEPGAEKYFMNLATLNDTPTTRNANADSIRSFMLGETQKAGTQRVKSNLTVLDQISDGMAFDLDAKNLFADTAEVKPTTGSVRYGLVLQDIEADAKAPKQAAISDSATALKYAGHADVKWTIGPVSEKSGRKLFAFKESVSAEESAPTGASIWSRLWVPKAAVKGSVAPENFDNLAKLKGGDSLPGWKVSLAQSEGLYRLTYNTKVAPGEAQAMHDFRIPIAGTAALGRRFDDKWDVIQTSAYDILYDKRLPLVSIHYLNVEERYKGDIGMKFDQNRQSLAVTAMGEAKGKVAKKADRPEQYGIEYTKEF